MQFKGESMEKKKNNALEKAEKAQTDVKKQKNKTKGESVKKQEQKRLKKEQSLKEKQERKLQKQQALAELRKQQAQKRVEQAKLKAHKKAEREKAKATLLREKNRRKAEKMERKEQLKRERQTRKQMLKNESKKDRQKRIALERQAKHDRKMQRKKQKAEKRAQVFAQKQALREQKNRDRQNRRKENKGFGGWLAAVISLGVATLVLASVLTFNILMPTTNDNMLNFNYERSFYDTIEQVDNIDLNLSKILASRDGGAIQKYLVNTAINSELAESDIQALPLHDESKFYTAKLINQIGDYAKYLNNKLIDGEGLSEKDREGLVRLYEANLSLKNALQKITSEMGGNYSFTELDKANTDDILLGTLGELENLSVQYPELIYDGPFSDGLLDRTVKGIKGKEISFDEAKEMFAKMFNDYSFSSIEPAGETSASINCYNIQGETDDGILFAQISKVGGNLIMFAYSGSCNNTVVSEEQAIENAQKFIEKMQIKNMQEVWLNLTGNVYTINFVGEQNGTIIYPDMIKVRVCAETGDVIGLEATEYYTNHTARTIGVPVISKGQAKQNLADEMVVKGVRKALVPIGNQSEKLCYEFYGEINGQTYYVYIDAINGKQLQMFKVVEGTEGQFLM